MDDSSPSGMDSWPVPVLIHTGKEKLVKLNELPKSLKIRAWNEIQSTNPALANLLREDMLKQVVDFFSASIYIESQYAPCLPQERLRGRDG